MVDNAPPKLHEEIMRWRQSQQPQVLPVQSSQIQPPPPVPVQPLQPVPVQLLPQPQFQVEQPNIPPPLSVL